MHQSLMKKHPKSILTAVTVAATIIAIFIARHSATNSQLALAESTTGYRSTDIVLPGQESQANQGKVQLLAQANVSLQPIDTNGGLLEEGTLGLGGMRPDGHDKVISVYPEQEYTVTLERAADEFTLEEGAEMDNSQTMSSHITPLAQQISTAKVSELTVPTAEDTVGSENTFHE